MAENGRLRTGLFSRLALVLLFLAFGVGLLAGLFSRTPAVLPVLDPGGQVEVHFIDVGQGDAILVTAGGRAALIDGGEAVAGPGLVAYLREQGIEHVDALIATHPHADHIGGFLTVLEELSVGEVYDTGQVHPTGTYERFLLLVKEKNLAYRMARAGMKIPLTPGLDLELLAPPETPIINTTSDINNNSAVVRLQVGPVAFLFTGDIETEAEEMLVRLYPDLDVTVLKVAHHGSRSSSSEVFLETVKPAVAVISVGAGNPYGHPHQAVLERLARYTTRIYRTDRDGTIRVGTDGRDYWIMTTAR